MIDFNKIPKIELHVHLDGSVRKETLKELYDKDINDSDIIAKDKCKDLNDYLTKFEIPISVMQSKENLKRISHELTEDLVKDNVVYAEIRFAPLKHTKNLTPEEVVESVLEGLKNNEIKTNLLLCMMRNDEFEENLKVISLAEKYLNKGVCGIDLAGAEAIYETKEFEKLFSIAREKNIPFTIHAGEASGIESIKSAINFGAKRLGHGIRCIEDDKIVDLIKEKDILLEICPTSNYQTNTISEYSDHPIFALYNNDVNISINTDNRTVSNITLTKEYEKLNKYFGFKTEDFNKINLNTIKYTFLKEEEKQELSKLFTL